MALTKITSAKQFRRGRVLQGLDHDLVLVNSPAPRVWSCIRIDHVDKRASVPRTATSYHAHITAKVLQTNYRTYDIRLDERLTSTDMLEVMIEAKTRFGLADIAFPVRQALTRPGGAGIGRARLTSSMKAATAKAMAPPKGSRIEEAWREPLPVEETVAASAASGKRSTSFATPKRAENPYWYESENDSRLIRDAISLADAEFIVNVMIAGPSGSGKTVGIENLGKALGVPVHKINCQAITTPEKWLGQMVADSEGTHFEPSQHIQWVERSHPDCVGAPFCIMLYDEITRLRAELNNMTYSLFDTQRGLEVPQMGRLVRMDPKNRVFATANIGAAFAGTFGQDRAFRERFAMTIERKFPPMDEEIKILTTLTEPPLDTARAKELVEIANLTRQSWEQQKIEQPISTRSLVMWALLVAGGYSVMEAAEYTVLPLYTEDGGETSDRQTVRLQIERKAA